LHLGDSFWDFFGKLVQIQGKMKRTKGLPQI
jgi:hypothetical protein